MRARSVANWRLAVLVDNDSKAVSEDTFIVPMKGAAEASLLIDELVPIRRSLIVIARVGSPFLGKVNDCQRRLSAVGQQANEVETTSSVRLDLDLDWAVNRQIEDDAVSLSQLGEIRHMVRQVFRSKLHGGLRADEFCLGNP